SPTIGVAELRKGSCFVPVGLSPKREDYPGLGTSKSICPQALPRKARRAAFTPSLVKPHPHSVLPMRRVIRHRGVNEKTCTSLTSARMAFKTAAIYVWTGSSDEFRTVFAFRTCPYNSRPT